MMAASGAARKGEIRARLLAARRDRPAGSRQEAARRLAAGLTQMLGTRFAGDTVAGYEPLAAEPGGPGLPAVLAAAVGPAGRVLLPVLRPDRDLDWTTYPPGPVRLPPAAIRAARLLVVPAVAVDRRGVRLGRGGGSYDRALARLAPGTEVVALLYDDELVPDPLPAEPHDQRVTAVLTPAAGLVRLPIEA